MSPSLAAPICILFVAYMFWRERIESSKYSFPLWIPTIWMFLAGGRYVSSWLNLRPETMSVATYNEGSPIDAAAFLSLIVAGVIVLWRRRIDWGRLLTKNIWIVLYFLYCLSSIGWTDDPFTLLKRWIKDLGNPIMVLVMMTERRPIEAVGIVLRRLAFLWLPLSVLFIKYYPDLGRAYHIDGSPMFTGVGHQKNDLGQMCLVAGIYLFWEILQKGRVYPNINKRRYVENSILIVILIWLLHISDSQTSFACLVTAVILLFLSRISFIAKKPSRIIVVIISSSLFMLALEVTLHVKDFVFSLLGRDPSLTSRTEIWQLLWGMDTNPIVGVGFMSFWAGDRVELVSEKLGAGINQAHSGYLEQYLNLGYIGLAFILVIMLSALLKIRKQLDVDAPVAMLKLSLIVSAALYNYTEAAFYGINNLWLLLLLASIDISGQRAIKRSTSVGIKKQRRKPVIVAGVRHEHPLSPDKQELNT